MRTRKPVTGSIRRWTSVLVAAVMATLSVWSVIPAAGAASPPAPRSPIGVLEAADASPGLIRLSGWAADPDGDPKTPLHVSYDGREVLETKAALARPDVTAALGLSPTTGFRLVMPILPGVHLICVDALNTGPTGPAPTTVGCVGRVIPGAPAPRAHDPRGNFEYFWPTPGHSSTQFDWAPDGWAYDPDTAGPINVRIRALYQPSFVSPPVNYRLLTHLSPTGAPRPDVAAAIPAAGANAGFGTTFTGTVYPYLILSSAYAENVGPGATQLIGCLLPFH